MKDGFIKIYRAFIASDLWLKEPFTKGQAWVDLIALTNFKPGEMDVKNGTTIKLKRGQCGYSLKGLADRWSWSRAKVKRFFVTLKNAEMINFEEVENRYIVTVLNYRKYQDVTVKTEKRYTKRYSKRTQEKKEKKERDSKLSLSHEEREILKNYLSHKKGKGKVEHIEAYLDTIIKNGSYLPILEKEKSRIERKQQEEIIPPPENFEEDEEPLSAQELQKMMRSKLVFLNPNRVKES